MKTVKLKSLSLNHFKGIDSLSVDFSENTIIEGANATGKTTIYDAFLWLFFGKDSTDRKDFAVKPLDKDGNEIHHLDTVVTGVMLIDGIEVELMRIQSEHWTKPKGQINRILTGNDQEMKVNNVPFKPTEFKKYINDIVDENIFKMVTKSSYFTSLPWKDMRRGLLSLIGEVTNNDIIAQDKYKKLSDAIIGKDLEDYTKEIKAEIAKGKKAIKEIPARIEEQNRGLEVVEKTEREVSSKLLSIGEEIKKVDEAINDANKQVDQEVNKQALIKSEIKAFQSEQTTLVEKGNNPNNDKAEARDKDLRKVNSQIEEKDSYLNSKQRLVDSNTTTIETLNADIANRAEVRNTLIASFKEIKALSFDNDKAMCPTCKQSLPTEQLEEVKAKFNSDKLTKLEDNKKLGVANKTAVEESTSKIEKIKETNVTIQSAINSLNGEKETLIIEKKRLEILDVSVKKVDAAQSIEYKDLTSKIEEKQALIKDVKVDNEPLIEEKKELNSKRDEFNKIINVINSNSKIKNRIEELEKEQREVSQHIADYEGIEFLILEFNKTKIELVETSINNLFTTCTFKMFETQVNGTEVETCKCLINGVTFEDANTASKVRTGLDIVRVFGDKFEVKAPVFCDNAESTSEFPSTDFQLIKLKVNAECKELKLS